MTFGGPGRREREPGLARLIRYYAKVGIEIRQVDKPWGDRIRTSTRARPRYENRDKADRKSLPLWRDLTHAVSEPKKTPRLISVNDIIDYWNV